MMAQLSPITVAAFVELSSHQYGPGQFCVPVYQDNCMLIATDCFESQARYVNRHDLDRPAPGTIYNSF